MNKKKIQKILRRLVKDGWELRFADAARKELIAALKKCGQWGGEMVKVGFAFDVENEAAVKAVERIVEGFSKTAANTALSEIKDVLTWGMEEGKSISEIQKKLRDLYDEVWRDRADLIARTETMRAANAGLVEGWKQSGIVTKKIWLTAGDACEECAPLNGMEVGIEETFFDKGDEHSWEDGEGNKQTVVLDYDDVDAPPLHPNCYAEGTEVLTDRGWLDFRSVRKADRIWSLDLTSATAEYIEIRTIIAYRYTGKMIRFLGYAFDLLVSPDHGHVIADLLPAGSRSIPDEVGVRYIAGTKLPPEGFNLIALDAIRPGEKRDGLLFPDGSQHKLLLCPYSMEAAREIDYDGMVYDVELERNHTLFIRYNGKVMLSGNCRCTIISATT